MLVSLLQLLHRRQLLIRSPALLLREVVHFFFFDQRVFQQEMEPSGTGGEHVAEVLIRSIECPKFLSPEILSFISLSFFLYISSLLKILIVTKLF